METEEQGEIPANEQEAVHPDAAADAASGNATAPPPLPPTLTAPLAHE
jgi:hypothetical protein